MKDTKKTAYQAPEAEVINFIETDILTESPNAIRDNDGEWMWGETV